MTDEKPRKTLSITRKPASSTAQAGNDGNAPTGIKRTGKRIITREQLPDVQKPGIPKKPPKKPNKPTQGKRPRQPPKRLQRAHERLDRARVGDVVARVHHGVRLQVRQRLAVHAEIVHATIEIHRCDTCA